MYIVTYISLVQHVLTSLVSFDRLSQEAPSLPLKIREDFRTECAKYGKVKKITVYDVRLATFLLLLVLLCSLATTSKLDPKIIYSIVLYCTRITVIK